MTDSQGGNPPVYDYNPDSKIIDKTNPNDVVITHLYKSNVYRQHITKVGAVTTIDKWIKV